MSDQYFDEEDFTTQFNKKTVLRILSKTRPYWHWVVGFIGTVVAVSFLDSYFTFLSKRIIDEGILAGNKSALTHIVTVYGLLLVIQAFMVFGFIYLAGVLGERVRYDLRRELFHKLQDLSLSYYSRTHVGWIMSRVTSDTERVSDLVTWGLLDVTWAAANIITSAAWEIIKVKRGGINREFHSKALKVAATEIGPRPTKIAKISTANKKIKPIA